LARAAQLSDPTSGRVIEVFTTEPGLQVYTGNGMENGPAGSPAGPIRDGRGCAGNPALPRCAAPGGLPSILLRPGEVYRSSTAFRLSVSPT